MTYEIGKIHSPEIHHVGFLDWYGTQEAELLVDHISQHVPSGGVISTKASARTQWGLKRKLLQQLLRPSRPKPVKQSARTGNNSVVNQAGRNIRAGYPDEQIPDSYDPALDWPDRYPDGGQ